MLEVNRFKTQESQEMEDLEQGLLQVEEEAKTRERRLSAKIDQAGSKHIAEMMREEDKGMTEQGFCDQINESDTDATSQSIKISKETRASKAGGKKRRDSEDTAESQGEKEDGTSDEETKSDGQGRDSSDD